MTSSTPPHCSITASKPYQNHPYPQNHCQNANHHHHHRSDHCKWTSHTVSLAKPHLPLPHSTAKPAASAAAAVAAQNPSFPIPSPLNASKSDLGAQFSGCRSTRFVSRMHLGWPKANAGPRHTSVVEEALQHAILYGKDDMGLENVLLTFESKLCGSDDYTFLLREFGNRGECWRAVQCFEFAVRRERRKNEQGKLVSAMISILGRLGKVDLAKSVFDTAVRAVCF